MKKYALLGALPLLMTACSSDNGLSEDYRYTPPTAVATNNTAEFNKPFDLVWDRAEEWLKDKRLTLQSQDRSSGLLAVQQENYADGLEFLDCGSGGSKVAIENPTMKINLILTESNGKTVATLSVKGTTTVSYLESDGRHVPAPSVIPSCVSKGTMEKDLMAALND